MSKSNSLKLHISTLLGPQGHKYWQSLASFVSGRLSKAEFEETVSELIVGPKLITLHNALVLSLLESGTFVAPPTPPPDGPKLTRKRKRLLPYQGPDSSPEGEGSLRSKRLKRWATSIGKQERDHIKRLPFAASKNDKDSKDGTKDVKRRNQSRPLIGRDIAMHERGVRLLSEGKDPPGTYLPLHLSSTTRAQSLQHILERLALVSSQNNLSAPSRQVASLLLLAFESKIKSLIHHAITLTSSSRAITSISPSIDSGGRAKTLGIEAFKTLLALSPHELPNGSASEVRMNSGLADMDVKDDADDGERHVDDPRWQLLAILKERSGVREALRSTG